MFAVFLPAPALALLFGTLFTHSVNSTPVESNDNPQCIVEEPAGYRMTDFRAPTPCTLTGATVLSTAALEALMMRTLPVLVDVMPAARRPTSIGGDALWLPPPRNNIAGSVWLPNTGFGQLPVEEERYFKANLARLSENRFDRKLVFYCEVQCWMSWNAARRAVEWGYRSVYWYPGGINAWQAAGHSLEPSAPVPRDLHQ